MERMQGGYDPVETRRLLSSPSKGFPVLKSKSVEIKPQIMEAKVQAKTPRL
jgi:hypothetical protein